MQEKCSEQFSIFSFLFIAFLMRKLFLDPRTEVEGKVESCSSSSPCCAFFSGTEAQVELNFQISIKEKLLNSLQSTIETSRWQKKKLLAKERNAERVRRQTSRQTLKTGTAIMAFPLNFTKSLKAS